MSIFLFYVRANDRQALLPTVENKLLKCTKIPCRTHTIYTHAHKLSHVYRNVCTYNFFCFRILVGRRCSVISRLLDRLMCRLLLSFESLKMGILAVSLSRLAIINVIMMLVVQVVAIVIVRFFIVWVLFILHLLLLTDQIYLGSCNIARITFL